jgi:hypothetical protein
MGRLEKQFTDPASAGRNPRDLARKSHEPKRS